MTDALFTIRDGTEADVGFLVGAWKSLKHAVVFDRAPQDHVRDELEKVLRSVLGDADVRMRVACATEDPDTILAVAVVKGRCLYFVYVAQPVRRLGLAKALCEDAAVESFAFSTYGFVRRMKPSARGWAYLPRISWGAS